MSELELATTTTRTTKEEEALSSFIYALKSKGTQEQYLFRLKIFFNFLEIPGKTIEEQATSFLDKVNNQNPSPEWAENYLIRFITDSKRKIEENKLSATSLSNYVIAIRLFYEMNNIPFNWKRISRGLPKARIIANDRAPTIEEIRKIVEYSDRRIKSIVYVMCSSGIRVGAWEWLKWKHVIPIPNTGGIAKLVVYAGESEEYYSFISPEAYNELKSYMDFRASYGEKITGESWLIRDLFRTSSVKCNQRYGLAKYPRKISEEGITKLLSRAIDQENIRGRLKEGQRRYEWKTSHGLRTFFCTRAEQVMKPLNVQILMGHNIGLIGSYLKPTEAELLEDYKKAVKLLSVNDESTKSADLQNKVAELTEKTEEQKYVIEGKLAERDKQIEEMRSKMDTISKAMQSVQRVMSIQEEYSKFLLDNREMQQIAKEVEKEQEEEEAEKSNNEISN